MVASALIGGTPANNKAGIMINPKRPADKLNDPFYELNDLILTKGIAGADPNAKPDPKDPGVILPIGSDPKDPKDPKAVKPAPTKPAVKPIAPS